MKKQLITAASAAFLLVAGCAEESDHAHGSGSDHDHDGAHDNEPAPAPKPAEVKPAAEAAVPAATNPVQVPIGGIMATLTPGAEALTLTLNNEGTEVKVSDEAKVVLTGTDEEPQRVVLKATGQGWSGAAKASGAKGYTAVISMTIDGKVQTAKASWGEVPKAPEADEGHGHGDHEHAEEDEGHSHGEHGHDH